MPTTRPNRSARPATKGSAKNPVSHRRPDVTIVNSKFSNLKRGIVAPHDAKLSLINTTFENVDVTIERTSDNK